MDLKEYLQIVKESKRELPLAELDTIIYDYSINSIYDDGDDLSREFTYFLKNGDTLKINIVFVGGLKRILKQIQKGDFDYVEEITVKLKDYKIIKK